MTVKRHNDGDFYDAPLLMGRVCDLPGYVVLSRLKTVLSSGAAMTQQIPRFLTYQNIPVWRHAVVIQWVAQLVSAFIVVGLVAAAAVNLISAINERNISYSFSFLSRAYQTPIGDHFLPYDANADTFLYAIAVAATNTLFVAIIGVILAIALGIIMGVMRLSGNWLVAKTAMVYVEFFRNVPLLVQLFFWWVILLALPPIRESYILPGGFFVNNRGLSFPGPAADGSAAWLWLLLALAVIAAGVIISRRLARRELETGQASYPVVAGWGVVLLGGALSWIIVSLINGAPPLTLSIPEQQGRFLNIVGGQTFKPGMVALLIGLVMYTAAFIAEIVRAGIQSVSRGQTEAARALGLTPMSTLRTVIFPQALRVIIPPLISQCLNLTKNSSLGIAVGYSELTGIAQTMTQTAPAISIFLLIMLCYLAMSLTWSLIGNIYNWRIGASSSR